MKNKKIFVLLITAMLIGTTINMIAFVGKAQNNLPVLNDGYTEDNEGFDPESPCLIPQVGRIDNPDTPEEDPTVFRFRVKYFDEDGEKPEYIYVNITEYWNGSYTTDNETIFNFTVVYKDIENTFGSVNIIIDNERNETMLEVNSSDNNYTDGKEYYFNTKLSFGEHKFYFKAYDGDENFPKWNKSYYYWTSWVNSIPILQNGSAELVRDNGETYFKVEYIDLDKDSPIYIRVRVFYKNGTEYNGSPFNLRSYSLLKEGYLHLMAYGYIKLNIGNRGYENYTYYFETYDGISIGKTQNYSYNIDIDLDKDGLSSWEEVNVYGTNNTNWDTDGDGLADGYNKTINRVFRVGELSIGTNNTNWDTDNDGLADGYNITINGVDRIGELSIGTNNTKSDTDGDGLWDGQNIMISGSLKIGEMTLGKNPKIKDIYGFALIVSFNWNVNESFMNDFIAGMRSASNYLYDVSDGYLYFKEVKFYDNNGSWNNADIRVYNSEFTPNANYGGITTSSGHINLPHNWSGDGYSWDYSWTNSNAYRTIIHELGHYALFLYDEYLDAEGDVYPRNNTTGVPEGPPGLMNYQYEPDGYSEMTTEVDYDNWSPPSGYNTTYHRYKTGESTWETFFNHYNSYNGIYKKAIEFDLNKDGVIDTSFPENYVANSGPNYNIGQYMKVAIYNT